MTKTFIFISPAVLLTAFMAAGQAPTTNETPTPQNMMRMYDPATETNLKGTVDEVKTIHHGRMMTGTHLMLKVGDETKEIMLGPSNFVESKGFTFTKGDSIELTGSKVTMGGTDYVIAREVIKDGKTLTLRDKNGVPQWAGMRMGRGAPAK